MSETIKGIPADSRFSQTPEATEIRYGSWQEYFDAVQRRAARRGTSPSSELRPIPRYLFIEFGEMPTPPWQGI